MKYTIFKTLIMTYSWKNYLQPKKTIKVLNFKVFIQSKLKMGIKKKG